MPLQKRPLAVKPISAGADPLDVRAGQPVLPVERIKIFSPEQWEDFTSEGVLDHPERLTGAHQRHFMRARICA